jgi:DNA invertase Pin-like site-specific DNA recombinase
MPAGDAEHPQSKSAHRCSLGKSCHGAVAQRHADHEQADGVVGRIAEEVEGSLAACKKRKARLVIAKLDRLSRNLAFIANLIESGTDFVAADNPHANKSMVQMMAVFAEMERDAISKRTREALVAAKARGVKLGNPRLAEASAKANAAAQEAAERFAANVVPIIQASGVTSFRGVARALTARGVKTARGGQWTARAVINVLVR